MKTNHSAKLLALSMFLCLTSLVQAGVPYRFGVAGYSFCRKSLNESLAVMQRANIHYLCVKDFHLKYTATDAEIAAFKAKCAAAGVVPYALGPLYTRDVESVRAYFAFAKRYGAKVIVGVPYLPGDEKDSWDKRKGSREQLLEIDRLVKQYDIRYAIHNHGPASPEMYPDVAYGWELIKDLDSRIGFCLDVGWEYGAGKDPVKTIREHGDRIFDVHLKDFEVGQPDGAAIPLGRGKLNFPAILQALADVGYDGVCALEYEKDFNDNLVPLAECSGYFRGVAAMIVPKPRIVPAPADANTLTPAERAAGWRLLWDGKTSTGWVSATNVKAFPERGWEMKDRTLTMRPMNGIAADGTWFPLPPEDRRLGGGGDIVTAEKFRDFEFSFDFRLTRAANSGIKYYFDECQNKMTTEEYQILEPLHPDYDKGREGNRRLAALYDLVPTCDNPPIKPLGSWNSGRIVARGSHVEHWLNGVKVLEYERGSKAFRDVVAISKYAKWGESANGKPQPWGEVPEGRILIQDHGDSTVSFCNLKIRTP